MEKTVDHLISFRRACAFVFDLMICYYLIDQISVNLIDEVWLNWISFFLIFLYFFTEGAFFLGQSIGKKILKIKTISVNGPLTRFQSLGRALLIASALAFPVHDIYPYSPVRTVLFLTAMVGLWLVCFFSAPLHPERRTFLDLISQTAVVKTQSEEVLRSKAWQGWRRSTTIASALSLFLVLLGSSLFTYYFNDQLSSDRKIEMALSEQNHRDVAVTHIYRNENGVKSVLLQAVIHVADTELEDVRVRAQYIGKNMEALHAFNTDPTVTHFKVALFARKRLYFLFPLSVHTENKEVAANLFPLK